MSQNYNNIGMINGTISTGNVIITTTITTDGNWKYGNNGYTYYDYPFDPIIDKQWIIEKLRQDPELLNEIIVELRKEKIKHIQEKNK